MLDMDTRLDNFFDLCEKTHKSLKMIDMQTQFRLVRQVSEEFSDILRSLETTVNVMTVKDLSKEIRNRKNILKLLYILFACLDLCGRNGIYSYESDARCEGTVRLAYSVMRKRNIYRYFGQQDSWYKNEILFKKGLCEGMLRSGIHHTLLQNLVRGCLTTLQREEYKSQSVYKYLENFENVIFTSMKEDRIALAYI